MIAHTEGYEPGLLQHLEVGNRGTNRRMSHRTVLRVVHATRHMPSRTEKRESVASCVNDKKSSRMPWAVNIKPSQSSLL